MGTKDHYGDSIVGKRTRTPGEAALDSAEAAMRECLTRYPDYEEFDPLRRVLGLPLYMAPNYRDDLFSTSNPTEGTE